MRPVRPIAHAEATPLWLRRFTKLVAFSTLFLIFAGAMVTSTGSGLAVPDWPKSYGMWFPPMVGGVFYEHGHRMIAATVGFLTVLQAIWLQFREPKRWLRILGWCAVGAVICQGLLGGLTVLFLLPPAISIAHAGLAEIFFCCNVSIAFFASRWFGRIRMAERADAPTAGTTALVLLVYAQILAGALMRHLHAGLAIPDFPLSFGRLVPAFTSTAVAVNFVHRFGAAAVAIAVIAMYIRLLRFEARHPLRLVANMLILVVPTQILLGAYTVWSGKQPIITSLHVVTGALTLAIALLLALSARTIGWRLSVAPPPSAGTVRDYFQLSKSRIVLMVLITTAAGFFYAAPHGSIVLLINTLIGTALVAAGTNALNEYVERDLDASMRRTQGRPLPAGRISPRAALVFSSAVAVIGTAYLALSVNWLTALLGAFTLITYIFVYTPLKRVSTICTLIGAIPGAVPPLMGWTAATGRIGLGGLIAFGVVFLWQLPHFMAISWMYREDYGRAGFAMLSVRDHDGAAVARQALYYSLALIVLSAFLPARFAAITAAAALAVMSIVFLRDRSNRNARRLFLTSNVYLLVAMALLVMGCSHQSKLPKLFPVPNAKLVADNGKPVDLDSFKGKVTVYDFIFTNCAGTCPMMTATLRRVTTKIDKDEPVRFVSISVDPRRDTPAALRNYASKVRNDDRWHFLTGDEKTIVNLSIDGFKLAASNTGSTSEAVLHSSKFAIADKHGMIRDYYGATNDDAVEHVTATVHDLLRED